MKNIKNCHREAQRIHRGPQRATESHRKNAENGEQNKNDIEIS